MSISGHMNKQVYGSAVVERLTRSPYAARLKKELREFKQVHGGYLAACEKADAAEARRDDALGRIGEADGGLDGSILELANRLVGAGLGERRNPFAAYSPHSPAAMASLAYAEELKAAQGLVKTLRKAKLPPDAARALKSTEEAAAEVAAALGGLTAPQSDYEAALRERDELLLGWTKALGRLKRAAAVAYDEDRAGYRAAFAPVGRVQAPKRHPRKRPAQAAPAAAPK